MLAVTVIIDGAFLLGYAQIAARGARALKGSRVISWLERAFGAALIFFGIKLLLAHKWRHARFRCNSFHPFLEAGCV